MTDDASRLCEPFRGCASVITAAITAAIAGILAYFGVKPGVYLAGVAIVVKILVVASIMGAMWWRQRAAQRKVDREAAQTPALPEDKR